MAQADFGARLRAAREARGVTLRAIADRTKISLSVLEALERGDFSRLPGGIFSRAFIRAYATEAGLDPEATLREFLEYHPDPVVPLRDVLPVGERPARSSWMGRALVVAVLVTATVAGVAMMGWPQRLAGPATPETLLPPAPAPAELPAPATLSPPPVPEDREAAVVVTGRAAGAADAAADAAPATVGGREAPAVAVRVRDGEPLRLVIKPTGRCWVRLIADGEVRLSRELVPGEQVSFTAWSAFVVTVGDAGAFTYAINGVPGRSLGGSGRVVTVRIERSNLGDFVAG